MFSIPQLRPVGVRTSYIFFSLIFPEHLEFWTPLQIPICAPPPRGCILLQSSLKLQVSVNNNSIFQLFRSKNFGDILDYSLFSHTPHLIHSKFHWSYHQSLTTVHPLPSFCPKSPPFLLWISTVASDEVSLLCIGPLSVCPLTSSHSDTVGT